MALLILARCCLTASSPVLSKPPQQTDSEGSWQISAQESGTNTLRLSVFEWRGWCGAGWVIICAHTPWGICLMVLIGRVIVLIGREEVGWYTWEWWSRAGGSPGPAPLAAPSAGTAS